MTKTVISDWDDVPDWEVAPSDWDDELDEEYDESQFWLSAVFDSTSEIDMGVMRRNLGAGWCVYHTGDPTAPAGAIMGERPGGSRIVKYIDANGQEIVAEFSRRDPPLVAL